MKCPECDADLKKRAMGAPRASKKATLLYVVAGIVGGLWAIGIYLWSPVFLAPKGVGGIALCAIFYLAPGLGIGWYAASLPKLRDLHCRACGWKETTTVM